jgi:hypothetical protein
MVALQGELGLGEFSKRRQRASARSPSRFEHPSVVGRDNRIVMPGVDDVDRSP